MPGTLIIGYGNPLRGDDGLGWQVAGELAKCVDALISVVAVHQLTPELAEPVSDADLIIFVDASCDGEPGSWRCESIRPESETSQVYAHYFTPASLLGYANAIFNAKPTALLISAAAGSFDYGEVLTPSVAAVVPQMVRFICKTLEESRSSSRQSLRLHDVESSSNVWA
jgi:hydrogenase maturation protease